MVRNKLATAVLAISVLQAGLASALGLGEINLNSALNQPLDAEIRLLDTGELDPNQIVIQLASAADFDRAGVPRDFFLTNLRFEVELDSRGGGVIHVTTRDPVIEPYLNFLLEARWPSGRLMREYTALMDLPTFGDSAGAPQTPAAAVSQPTSAGGARGDAGERDGRASEPRSSAAATGQSRVAPTRMPEASDERQYRVQHNDTMYDIAGRFRSGSATVEQTMLAIQRLNSGAFINDNINLVKSGYVLRLPTADEASGIDEQQAQQEVASQNRAWRSGASGASDTGPQLDGREPTGGDAGGPQSEPRLSIASAGDSDRSAAGEGTGTGAGASTALRDELAASQESLDKTRRENEEMRSRLGDMERQIATLQRLIELKDDQLAALQSQVDSNQDMGGETGPDAAVDASDEPVDFNYAGADSGADTESAQAPAGARPAAQPQTPPPAPGLLERLMTNSLWLGGLFLALVAAVVAALVVRRRKEDALEPGEADFSQDELVLEDDEVLELADDAFDEALLEEQGQRTEAPEVQPPGAATPAATAVAAQPVRAETGDALAEADIYIAYGRYQQAADLLRNAIDSEPERTDLRVKLLEVHVEARDKNAFQEQFIALAALGNADAVAQVKDHLSTVDGVSGWLDDLPEAAPTAATATAAAIELEDDDELFADDDAADLDEADAEGFDFDLELDSLDGGSGLELENADFADLGSTAPAVGEAGEDETEDDDALNLDSLSGDAGRDADDLEYGSGTGADDASDAPLHDTSFTAASLELNEAGEFDAKGATTPATGDDQALDINLDGDDDFDLALEGADSDELTDLEFDFATPAASETGDLDLGGADLGGTELDLDLDGDDLNDNGERPFDSGLEIDSGDLDLAGSDLNLAGTELAAADGIEPSTTEPEPEASLEASSGFATSADADAESGAAADGQASAGPEAESAPAGTPAREDAALEQLDTAGDMEEWTLDSAKPEAGSEPDSAEDGALDFDAALAELNAESDSPADTSAGLAGTFDGDAKVEAEADDDSFDFLGDADDIATRLDLARAYIDMGDADGARDILEEVVQDGTEVQQQEAQELLQRI